MTFIDRCGESISREEWQELRKQGAYVDIIRSFVISEDEKVAIVGTMWAGVAPLPFETIVFQSTVHGVAVHRWGTMEEAMRGHHEVTKDVRLTMKNPFVTTISVTQ